MTSALLIKEIQSNLEKNPEKTAIYEDFVSYSYKELREFVYFTADILNQSHLKTVAIFGEPSFTTVGSILAALLSKAVYIPIEPSWPLNRINKILKHSGAEAVLTTSSVLKKQKLKKNDFSVPLVLEITPKTDSKQEKKFYIKKYNQFQEFKIDFKHTQYTPPLEKTDSSLVYIMYTSGSTGEPKGVEVPLIALQKFLHWVKAEFKISPLDRLSYTASLGFGASIRQIFSPILSQAQIICFSPETVRSPSVFLNALQKKQITVFNAPPIILQQLASQSEKQKMNKNFLSNIRLVLAGGDIFSRDILNLWYDQFQHYHSVINLYGSTESIVNASSYKANKNLQQNSCYQFLPIGKPRPGVSFVIIDDRGKSIEEVNKVGDLYIQSAFLSKAYHNNLRESQKTFSQVGREILYKTGDRAILLDSKDYLVLGRKDRQAQMYGQRVEMSEIEKTLNSHPQIKRSYVVYFKDQQFDRITAYIQLERDSELEKDYIEQSLRKFVSQELPSYMMPHKFQKIDKVPVTESNKVDYKKLSEEAQKEFYISRKKVENLGREVDTLEVNFLSDQELSQEIENIWKKYLGEKSIKENQSFFDIGGDSVLAVNVYHDLCEKFSVSLNPHVFYISPTIKNIRQALKKVLDQKTENNLNEKFHTPYTSQKKSFFILNFLNFKKHLIFIFFKILNLSNKVLAFLYRKPSIKRGPQSPQQKSFVFMRQVFNEIYNGCFSVPIEGTFDKDKFRQAGQIIISSQESLRTVFVGSEQIVLADYPIEILFYDLKNRKKEEQEEFIKKIENIILREKFNFSLLPLFKIALFELSEQKFHFVFGINHIIGDEWSLTAFLSMLNSSYAFLNKKGPAPPLHSYFSYTKNYKAFCRKNFERNQKFWNNHLLDLSSYNLSSKTDQTELFSEEESLKIDSKLMEKINVFSKNNHTQEFFVYLSLWIRTLSEFLECQKICFWSTYHCRDFPFKRIHTMIGSIARIAPLLIDLSLKENEDSVLEMAQKAYMDVLEHKDFNVLKTFVSHKSQHISKNWIGFNYLNFKPLDKITEGLPFSMDWNRGQVRLSSSERSYKRVYMYFSIHIYKDYMELKVYGKALKKHKKQILNLIREKMENIKI